MEPIHEASVQTQPGKRLAESPKRQKKIGKTGKIIACAAAAAVVVFYGTCCVLAHTSSTYFPHTHINGVDVSGKNQDGAIIAMQLSLGSQTIDLTLEGESQPFTTVLMSDLLDQQPVDSDGVIAVYDRQHSGLFSGGWQYMRHLFSTSNEVLPYQWDENGLSSCISEIQQQVYQAPEDTTAQLTDGHLEVTTARDGRQISSDAVRELLYSAADASGQASYSMTLQPEVLPAKTLTAREIHDQLHGEVRNASYDSATDSIVPEQLGADFDIAAVQKAMDEAAPGETLTVKADIQQPEVTAADLKAVLFRDVLGEAKTHVSGSAGRIGNVKLSAQIINGLVLNSGETFSYNGSVGKRTADRGFKPAPAYVKGETVDEIGGGICQTSSTLYLACLLSNLEITERYAHRYVPAYIAWGMDATVSWGGPDYKFTNNTLYPVKIVTKYEKGYLTVQILGTNVDGTYVKMSNEVLSKTPWETIYQEDPTMAPGSPDVVKVTPYTGYKVNSYQTIYDKDGNVIDSHFEASSNYKVRNKVILQAPTAQPGSGTAEIPAVTPGTPSDTPVPMEPTVPAEPAASPDLPVEPEIPAEP